jgi:hypothetical protein
MLHQSVDTRSKALSHIRSMTPSRILTSMGFSEGGSRVVLCMPLWAPAAHIVQFGSVRIEQDFQRSDRISEVAEEPRAATTRQHRNHLPQPRHDGSPSTLGKRFEVLLKNLCCALVDPLH